MERPRITVEVPSEQEKLPTDHHRLSADQASLPNEPEKVSATDPDRLGVPPRPDSRLSSPASWFRQAHGDVWSNWEQIGSHRRKEHRKIEGEPLTWQHLFRPPVVRQWTKGEYLYRAEEDRSATYVELFYDLAFVGAIHLLADAAIDPEPNGINVLLFLILFFLALAQWVQVRSFVNLHGTDDVLQRIYLLGRMLFVIGFAVNAVGIEVEREELEDGTHGSYEIVEDTLPNVRWAARFQLIACCCQIVILALFSLALPRFRWAFAFEKFRLLLPAVFILPLCFGSIHDGRTILGLAIAGIAADWWAGWVIGAHAQLRAKSGTGWDGYRFAHSIDHLLERSEAFVVLVLGESILQSSYRAVGAEVGIHHEYGRAVLGIMAAFLMLWLFFDADASRVYVHGLRAFWSTAVMWSHAQYPLIAAIILQSAALANMVQNEESEAGFHWYYAGSIATFLLCTLFVGILHQSYDKRGSALLPRWVRLASRAVSAAFIAVVPLIHLDNLSFLGIIVSTLVAQAIFETVGKLGVIGDLKKLEHESEQSLAEGLPVKYPYNDLTAQEKGHEDAGIEDELGEVQRVQLRVSQRVAYTI